MNRPTIYLAVAFCLTNATASNTATLNDTTASTTSVLAYFSNQTFMRNSDNDCSLCTKVASNKVCCKTQFGCDDYGGCKISYLYMADYACSAIYKGTVVDPSYCGY